MMKFIISIAILLSIILAGCIASNDSKIYVGHGKTCDELTLDVTSSGKNLDEAARSYCDLVCFDEGAKYTGQYECETMMPATGIVTCTCLES